MSVPEARIFLKALNFYLSSTESQAINQYIDPSLTLVKMISRYPATVEAGAVTYDFQSVKFRYKEQENGSCVVFVVHDDLLQDKEILVDGLILCRGASLGGRMFVNPLSHTPRYFLPQVEGSAMIKASSAQTFVSPKAKRRMLKGGTRILYVSTCTLIGGQEVVLKRLLRHLDKTLYEADIIIMQNRGPLHDEYEAASDGLMYYDEKTSKKDFILNQIKTGNYDYVHFFNSWDLYGIIPHIKQVYPDIRIIVSLFADFYYHRESWGRDVERIQSVRPFLWAFTTDSYINKKVFPDVSIIRNGIPKELFCPAEKTPKTVAWLGRFIETKKISLIPEIAKRLPSYHFTVIGDKQNADAVKMKQMSLPNLEVKVELSETEVANILAKMEYFLFTSQTESMPLTILEALASGCCIISENVGDISTVIQDKVNGYLIPAGADTVTWVSENLPKLKINTDVARRTVLNEFTVDQMVKQYEFLYGQIGSHRKQSRIAFVWSYPDLELGFWERKIDSMQYAIAELSNQNCCVIFVPKPAGEKRKRATINGCNIVFYSPNDSESLVPQIKVFNPHIICLNSFGAINKSIVEAFPNTYKTISEFGDSLNYPLLKKIDVLFVQQEFRIKEALDTIPASKIVVNPFCVKTSIFKPVKMTKNYNAVMIADFRRELKRQDILIRAWKNIPGKLLLIARLNQPQPYRDYEHYCRQLIKELGLEERVILHDFIPNDQLPALLNQCKIGVMTSKREGGSRAMLEVMSCGLPMIVLSDSKGVIEMIRPGIDGLISDAENLSTTINSLLNNPVQLAMMGEAASDRIHREYPYDKMLKTYRDTVIKAKPEVSVITTSLNRASFLEDNIRSVMNQKSVARVNHIIMDGGSTDGSLSILEKYREVVHAYVKRDKGQTDAIVKALQIIKQEFPQTEYVGWINADDTYEPNWLADSLPVLMNSPPDVAMVCSDAKHISKTGQLMKYLDYTKDPYITLELFGERGNVVIQPTVLIKLDALQGIKNKTGIMFNPEYHYCQDLELWIRFLRNGYKIQKLSGVKVTANLRSHPGQMSLTHADKQHIERDRLLREVCGKIAIENPIWVKG